MTSDDQPMDHVSSSANASGETERSELEKNITARSTWIRLLFMIIYVFLYTISRIVASVVVLIQFFNVLFTGATNKQLKTLGHSLAIYSFEVTNYLTFNTEKKPFPFDAAWPTELPRTESADSDDD